MGLLETKIDVEIGNYKRHMTRTEMERMEDESIIKRILSGNTFPIDEGYFEVLKPATISSTPGGRFEVLYAGDTNSRSMLPSLGTNQKYAQSWDELTQMLKGLAETQPTNPQDFLTLLDAALTASDMYLVGVGNQITRNNLSLVPLLSGLVSRYSITGKLYKSDDRTTGSFLAAGLDSQAILRH